MQHETPIPTDLHRAVAYSNFGSEGMSEKWTRQEAINLCILIESVCPQFGCHVALTGGTLYKAGERKDCDVLFYRIRQVENIDQDGLFAALADIGVERLSGFGWVHKAIYQGKNIDMFFPEAPDGEYDREPASDDAIIEDLA